MFHLSSKRRAGYKIQNTEYVSQLEEQKCRLVGIVVHPV